jgi:Zn-dependent protease with chaperone function
MNCPRCGLESPATALRCDCGYQFGASPGKAVRINEIRYPGESVAFLALLLASILAVVGIVALTIASPPTGGVVIFYTLLFVAVSWLAKILAMAEIRGNGILVTSDQYPELHAYICRFSAALGLKKVPDVYVIQATLMNAFATKATGKRYVVLYSHLVDATLESGDYDEVAMIIGHELAHHAAGHVRWAGFLHFGMWLPFLYFYWRRKAEYTCDRAGMLLVDKLRPSLQGMVKLAVGRKLAAHTNMSAVRQQRQVLSQQFGPTLVEVLSTHPLTVKRLTEMEDFARGRVSS